ncbi:Ankyrin-3 [Dactylellina cionopaga]|nr:Ankyrin-3 [Dactylellina cionopaga]
MAVGTSGHVETIDRNDRVNRHNPPGYQCNPTSDPVALAYVVHPGSAEADVSHLQVGNTQPGASPQEQIAGDNSDRKDGSDDDDVSVKEKQKSFHRSKITDSLLQGEWDEAENHLSILLRDFNISVSPDTQILQAMIYNSKARWEEARDLLKDFIHQSASEPEMSARAYYAKAVALYKLKDYEPAHVNARRGLAVVNKYLQGPVQQRYRTEFGDLAYRCLQDPGNEADSAKINFYKSLISPDRPLDPILNVTTIGRPIGQLVVGSSESESTQLSLDMKKYRISFGHDGKLLVGRQKDFFSALHNALETDNLQLMTLICSSEWCATQALRESPIFFDLDPPMPQYAWRATTLLHVVAGSYSKYSAQMAQLLLDNGADPQKSLFEGITPLHICARQTNVEVASVLIKNGANIEARSITGKPPIHFAAWKASWNADVRILKMLIAAGANINAKNSGGYTALHWCMFDGRSAAPIDVLCQREEIDKFARAGNHKTPWEIFWEHEDEFIEKGEEKRVQILYTLRRYGITR